MAVKWAVTALRVIHIHAFRKFWQCILDPYLRLLQIKLGYQDTTNKCPSPIMSRASCAMGLGGCFPCNDSPSLSNGSDREAVMLLSRCTSLLGEGFQRGSRDIRLRVIELLAACIQVNDVKISGVALRKCMGRSLIEVSPCEIPNAELFISRLVDICSAGSGVLNSQLNSAVGGKMSIALLARRLLTRICHSVSWRRHIISVCKESSLHKNLLSLQPLLNGLAES